MAPARTVTVADAQTLQGELGLEPADAGGGVSPQALLPGGPMQVEALKNHPSGPDQRSP